MRNRPIDWPGRVALVTGASSGIGLAVTKALVEKEVRVAMIARSRERLDEVVGQLGRERVASFPLDVCDRGALLAVPGQVVEYFGRLDILVHSAGVNHRGVLAERSIDELSAILDANLVAPVLLTRAALPLLREGGAIVNIASLAGKVPIADEATYSASKAGLRAFGRALGTEVRCLGLTVTTVCPGPVDTGFLGDASDIPPLVFSQPMSTAERIAKTVIASIESGREEIDVPRFSGKLATLGYLSPALLTAFQPLMERRGARNKRRFLALRMASCRSRGNA